MALNNYCTNKKDLLFRRLMLVQPNNLIYNWIFTNGKLMKVFRYKYEITVSFNFIIISFVITTTAARFSSECTGKWTQGQLIPYTFAPNPFQNPFVQSGAARWTRGRGQGAAAEALASDRYIDANVREIYIVLVLDTMVARRYTAPRHSCPSGYAQGFSASSTTCKTLLHAQRILQSLEASGSVRDFA